MKKLLLSFSFLMFFSWIWAVEAGEVYIHTENKSDAEISLFNDIQDELKSLKDNVKENNDRSDQLKEILEGIKEVRNTVNGVTTATKQVLIKKKINTQYLVHYDTDADGVDSLVDKCTFDKQIEDGFWALKDYTFKAK